jgi:tetratricopeptide (TPR) repeat protein/O-antigen ligase
MTWDSPLIEARSPAVFLTLIGIGSLILIHATSPHESSAPKILIPLGQFLIWLTLLLTKTPVPFFGVGWIVQGLLLVLAFWLISEVAREDFPPHQWENAFIAIGLFIVLVDLLLFLVWRLRWKDITGSFFTPLPINIRLFGLSVGHPNIYGAYLNMIMPFVFIRLFRRNKIPQYILLFAILALLFFTQYLIASRGAWLGLFAYLPLMIILRYSDRFLDLFRRLFRLPERRISWKPILIGLSLIIGCFIMIFVLWNRFQNSAHGTFSDRLAIWNYALQLIGESPIWGHGPGSLQFLYALRSEGIAGDEVFHTHNFILEILGASGIAGLLIIAAAIFFSLHAFRAAWIHHPYGSTARDTLIACAGIGVGLVVHNQIDFLFEPFRLSAGALFAIALVYSLSPEPERFWIPKNFALVSQIGLLGLLTFSSWYALRGGALFGLGVKYFQEGNLPSAKECICKAADQTPQNTLYSFQCSLALAYLAWEQNDLTALQSAVEIQRSALEKDPYWYIHWANLASYEWELGEHARALEHLHHAIELAPKRGFLWMNLGWMEERLGNKEAALEAYHNLICLEPMQRFSPVFRGSDFHRDAITAECPHEFDTLGSSSYEKLLAKGRLAYESKDFAQAEQYFTQANAENPLHPLAYTYLGLIADKTGDREAAWLRLRTTAFLFDTHTFTLLQAGRIARKLGYDVLAVDFISRSFDLRRYPDFSSVYYVWAYQQFGLPTDLSPFLIRSQPAIGDIEAYKFLSDHLEVQGKIHQAQDLRNWMLRFWHSDIEEYGPAEDLRESP